MTTGTQGNRVRRILVGLGAIGIATAALAQSAVPVTVGRYDPELDACGSQGQVTGLNPSGDNFLAVRVGPGVQYEKFDELHKGDVVNICEQQGGWLGIVYGKEDCGVGTPLPKGPYAGPCRAGWVAEQYIVVTAG